jgi:2-alkyl-3-oxoalkanoate reductase
VPTPVALAGAGVESRIARLRRRSTELTPDGVRYLALRRGTYGIEKASGLLGWTPAVGVEEGMARTETWLRREGLI